MLTKNVEFNVSLGNAHMFATQPRSADTPEKVQELGNALKARFPEKEGYIVLKTEYQTVAHQEVV